LTPIADNPVIVPDRELEGDKKPGESEPPRIRCPLCGRSPRKEDKWFCICGNERNHFRHGRRLSSLPAPVERNPMPLVQPMVASFALVRGVTGSQPRLTGFS
jgi:hypothetical protein